MTKDEALKQLKGEFSEVRERQLSDGVLLTEVGPLYIPGGEQQTKVAIKLPEQITSVPEVFVETHITLNSGGQPASTSNVDIEGSPWKKWSFKTTWNPESYTMPQLIYAVLSRFNR